MAKSIARGFSGTMVFSFTLLTLFNGCAKKNEAPKPDSPPTWAGIYETSLDSSQPTLKVQVDATGKITQLSPPPLGAGTLGVIQGKDSATAVLNPTVSSVEFPIKVEAGPRRKHFVELPGVGVSSPKYSLAAKYRMDAKKSGKDTLSFEATKDAPLPTGALPAFTFTRVSTDETNRASALAQDLRTKLSGTWFARTGTTPARGGSRSVLPKRSFTLGGMSSISLTAHTPTALPALEAMEISPSGSLTLVGESIPAGTTKVITVYGIDGYTNAIYIKEARHTFTSSVPVDTQAYSVDLDSTGNFLTLSTLEPAAYRAWSRSPSDLPDLEKEYQFVRQTTAPLPTAAPTADTVTGTYLAEIQGSSELLSAAQITDKSANFGFTLSQPGNTLLYWQYKDRSRIIITATCPSGRYQLQGTVLTLNVQCPGGRPFQNRIQLAGETADTLKTEKLVPMESDLFSGSTVHTLPLMLRKD